MPVKKKIIHTNKITPVVSTGSEVLFDKLNQGECFLMNGSLYMKESGSDQAAVNLATGKYEDCLCGREIEPAIVTINWKKK